MTNLLWVALLFVSVMSVGSKKCGPPKFYEGRRLDEKHLKISEFKNGDKVTYKCNEGYMQTAGKRESFCLEGTWTYLNMYCKKKKCGSAGEIVNGRFIQNGNLFGASAYAECNEGFVLQGDRLRQCLDKGWSGTIPNCVEPHTLSPPSQSPALDADRAGEVLQDSAVTCRGPAVQNGKTNGTKAVYNPGERLLFSCHEGFQLQGNSSIVQCNRGGTWSPKTPKCARTKCTPLNIPNGSVNTTRHRVYTIVTVTCKSGTQLRGPKHITCGAGGSWDPSIPTCEPVSGNCGKLPIYQNIITIEEKLDQYKPGTRVQFMCTHGYRRAGGSHSIYCNNGRWTPIQLRCEKKKCGSAGEVENGRFKYTGVSFGDIAIAECHEGYNLIGEAVRRCRAEGWDGRMPVCEVVKCPRPPEVAGAEMSGFIDDEPLHYGQVVSYRCFFGPLIGVRHIYCTKNGVWSDSAPQCRYVF